MTLDLVISSSHVVDVSPGVSGLVVVTLRSVGRRMTRVSIDAETLQRAYDVLREAAAAGGR